MPEYLAKATNRDGLTESLRVKAESSRDAIDQIEADGFTDVKLYSDDITARHNDFDQVAEFFSNEELMKLPTLTRWRYFIFVCKKFYLAFYKLPLFGFVLIALGVWNSWSFVVAAGVLVVLSLAMVAVWAVWFGSSNDYDRMLQAFAWGKWQRVLDLIPPLEGKVAAFELDARAAVALAGLGRLEEGLDRINAHADSGTPPEWEQLARVAEVYSTAKEYDAALECHEKAFALAPENPIAQLALAHALIKRGVEIDRARALIARAEKEPLGDLLERLLPSIKGMLAIEEGRYRDATAELLDSNRRLEPLRPASPLIDVVIDFNHTALAVAYVRQEDRATAGRHFALAKPRLDALHSEPFADRYRDILATLE